MEKCVWTAGVWIVSEYSFQERLQLGFELLSCTEALMPVVDSGRAEKLYLRLHSSAKSLDLFNWGIWGCFFSLKEKNQESSNKT